MRINIVTYLFLSFQEIKIKNQTTKLTDEQLDKPIDFTHNASSVVEHNVC